MITKDQAMTEREIHASHAGRCMTWRRNGRTQTWKTRPDDYRMPVKYGLYEYGQVTPAGLTSSKGLSLPAEALHMPGDCPKDDAAKREAWVQWARRSMT